MSSHSFESPDFGQQPPQKQGMSTGAKVLLILGIVFGCLGLLCCGGVAVVFWWGSGLISDDPAEVARVTDEIVQMDIPEELDPQISINVKIPFTGQQVMVMTVHAEQETNSGLVLVAVGEMMAEQDQEQIRQQIDQSLNQQSVEGQERIVIEESYEKQFNIKGQPATFTISKGKGIKTKTSRVQASGVFQGKTGPVMIMFDGHAEKFTEERVVEMLESIEDAEPMPDVEQLPAEAADAA